MPFTPAGGATSNLPPWAARPQPAPAPQAPAAVPEPAAPQAQPAGVVERAEAVGFTPEQAQQLLAYQQAGYIKSDENLQALLKAVAEGATYNGRDVTPARVLTILQQAKAGSINVSRFVQNLQAGTSIPSGEYGQQLLEQKAAEFRTNYPSVRGNVTPTEEVLRESLPKDIRGLTPSEILNVQTQSPYGYTPYYPQTIVGFRTPAGIAYSKQFYYTQNYASPLSPEAQALLSTSEPVVTVLKSPQGANFSTSLGAQRIEYKLITTAPNPEAGTPQREYAPIQTFTPLVPEPNPLPPYQETSNLGRLEQARLELFSTGLSQKLAVSYAELPAAKAMRQGREQAMFGAGVAAGITDAVYSLSKSYEKFLENPAEFTLVDVPLGTLNYLTTRPLLLAESVAARDYLTAGYVLGEFSTYKGLEAVQEKIVPTLTTETFKVAAGAKEGAINVGRFIRTGDYDVTLRTFTKGNELLQAYLEENTGAASLRRSFLQQPEAPRTEKTIYAITGVNTKGEAIWTSTTASIPEGYFNAEQLTQIKTAEEFAARVSNEANQRKTQLMQSIRESQVKYYDASAAFSEGFKRGYYNSLYLREFQEAVNKQVRPVRGIATTEEYTADLAKGIFNLEPKTKLYFESIGGYQTRIGKTRPLGLGSKEFEEAPVALGEEPAYLELAREFKSAGLGGRARFYATQEVYTKGGDLLYSVEQYEAGVARIKPSVGEGYSFDITAPEAIFPKLTKLKAEPIAAEVFGEAGSIIEFTAEKEALLSEQPVRSIKVKMGRTAGGLEAFVSEKEINIVDKISAIYPTDLLQTQLGETRPTEIFAAEAKGKNPLLDEMTPRFTKAVELEINKLYIGTKEGASLQGRLTEEGTIGAEKAGALEPYASLKGFGEENIEGQGIKLFPEKERAAKAEFVEDIGKIVQRRTGYVNFEMPLSVKKVINHFATRPEGRTPWSKTFGKGSEVVSQGSTLAEARTRLGLDDLAVTKTRVNTEAVVKEATQEATRAISKVMSEQKPREVIVPKEATVIRAITQGKTQTQTKTLSLTKAQTKTQAITSSKTEAILKAVTQAKTETKTQTLTQAKTQTLSKALTQTKTQTETQTKTQTLTQAKTQTQTQTLTQSVLQELTETPTTTTITPTLAREEKKQKLKKRSKVYDVLVRRHGKFKTITPTPEPFGEALATGVKVTKNTLAATFKTVAKGLAEQEETRAPTLPRANEFYTKQEKGEKLYIQKRGTRLGTLGERREIQQAKRFSIPKVFKF